jgi:3',5'-cyclic AMP phosphodiesterase CpdA
MLSRRKFIKKMIAFFSFVPFGIAGLFEWLNRVIPKEEPAQTETRNPPVQVPEKKASDVPLLSFFLLSDTHISVGESSMTDKLHWALQDITSFESKVEAVIFGGDLTDFGRASDYALLKKILNQYELPQVYGNMGNHDYYDVWLNSRGAFAADTVPNGKTDAQSRERFQTFFGYQKPYNDFWVNGVHLILVSQEAYVEEKPDVGEGAWYSDEQLAWLKETMKNHEDGKPAFVFIHQPLPDPGLNGRSHQLIRAKEFRSILKPYKNVFVFSGHTHRNFVGDNSHYNTQNTFHWFINSSVGRIRSNEPGGISKFAQGLYVQVYEDRVVLRGREFSNRTWISEANWVVPLV